MVVKLPSMCAVVIKDVTRQSLSLLKTVNGYLQSVTTNNQFKLYKHCTSISFFCTFFKAMQKHLRTTYKLVYSFRSQTRRLKCEKLSERSSRLHNRKWSCGCKMSAMPSAQRREASESRRLLLLFNAVLFSCLQAPLISTYGTHIYIYVQFTSAQSSSSSCIQIHFVSVYSAFLAFCFLPHKLTFCFSELRTRPQGFVCQQLHYCA